MISNIDIIEAKDANNNNIKNSIFRNIGQLLKAYVKEKIAQDLYIISFSNASILANSKKDLKKGDYICLRVEALKPKILLRQLDIENTFIETIKYNPVSLKDISIWKLIKNIYLYEPNLRSIIRFILNGMRIKEKEFWNNLIKLYLYLEKDAINNKYIKEESQDYMALFKTLNKHAKGLYLQIPCFYYIKDIEVFFSFKKGDNPKNIYKNIFINLNLSRLGNINIVINDRNKDIQIMFYVKEIKTLNIIKEQIKTLKNNLKRNYLIKQINLDCKIMPKKYWERGFFANILYKGEKGLDFIA